MLSHKEQFANKCNFLDQHFFSHLCAGQTVLEVGCFDGDITEVILKHNPRALVALEANEFSSKVVQKKFPGSQIIYGDMHSDFPKAGPVDVAFLLGVIYHTHAPLFVLEELVNHCEPKHVVIDNMSTSLGWHTEIPNVPGMRYTVGKRKTCDIVINIGDEIITEAMINLGYRLVKQLTYPDNSRAPGMPIFYFVKGLHE